MGSETCPPQLPVIDFSNLEGNWNSVKSQVYDAVTEYGCFEAKVFDDKVPLQLRKAIFGALEELFDLPLEKKKLSVSRLRFHGYVGHNNPMMPLFESIGIDDADNFDLVNHMTNIWWPQGNPSLSKTVHSYTEKLSELDQVVRKMILESLGVEKYMEEHINSTNSLIRFNKFKSPQTSDTKLGLTAHTDANFVTILYTNQVGGLQFMTKDEKWISYKPSPDTFVVLVGDSFHAWSNGRLHSPFHRVMMSGNEAKYTILSCSIPNKGYIIKAPEELVDEEHPLLYKPFDHFEYIDHRTTGNAQTDKFHLRTFCGV
ncbi:unnamed protein product [Trifolium pratense]|uniref:Uncharacterized protein n=1 Tax=Trifolium pratense TaxID=57577 RepID=A0ACB0K9W4_TRIPR|nr:unnamed protein product [Trifolium pratense]